MANPHRASPDPVPLLGRVPRDAREVLELQRPQSHPLRDSPTYFSVIRCARPQHEYPTPIFPCRTSVEEAPPDLP
eukprot:6118009-Pyramimonas_sp.AAC.2